MSRRVGSKSFRRRSVFTRIVRWLPHYDANVTRITRIAEGRPSRTTPRTRTLWTLGFRPNAPRRNVLLGLLYLLVLAFAAVAAMGLL